MSDKNGLQLLPETRHKLEIKVPGENRLLYVSSTLLVLVLTITIGLKIYTNSLQTKLVSLNNDLQAIESQRNSKIESQILTFNKQLSLVSGFLKNHILWSKGLGRIENKLQSQVQFESLSGSTDETKLDFTALAANYTVIARQLASLTSEDSINDVTLTNVKTMTSGRLEFSISIRFNKDKFLK